MSRRKQTNPFKVNWTFPTAGLSAPEHVHKMEGGETSPKTASATATTPRRPRSRTA
ncbi:hypothetical protein SKAU_G00345920 [Synaphobranchus kaupii]|uniref:Uncharacterized protein n=1 Tax=Synaphobranchus kaupii TaxID=118154 RepID=A0A9Q1IHQ8_SYNKA|nr:hypothetical protein SKAU_G00345920 [Synaphobranchus kaupii]